MGVVGAVSGWRICIAFVGIWVPVEVGITFTCGSIHLVACIGDLSAVNFTSSRFSIPNEPIDACALVIGERSSIGESNLCTVSKITGNFDEVGDYPYEARLTAAGIIQDFSTTTRNISTVNSASRIDVVPDVVLCTSTWWRKLRTRVRNVSPWHIITVVLSACTQHHDRQHQNCQQRRLNFPAG